MVGIFHGYVAFFPIDLLLHQNFPCQDGSVSGDLECTDSADSASQKFGESNESNVKAMPIYGKSPFFMGKLTISMAIFNSKLLVYQRVLTGA